MNGQFDLGAMTPQHYFFGIAVVLGALFATVGEVDAGTSVAVHFLIWQLQTVIPMALFVASHILLEKIVGNAGRNPWLQLLISGGLGAVLFTPINLGIDVLLQREDLAGESVLAALLGEILSMGPPAMISWLAINAPWVMGFRFATAQTAYGLIADSAFKSDDLASATAASESSVSEENPLFMTLIPALKRGKLIYLKADLHYLSVITNKGRSLLLYNLRDAIREVREIQGMQCHRSYWVSLAEVVAFEKKGRQGMLKLTNGSEVPVSRSYISQVTQLLEGRSI